MSKFRNIKIHVPTPEISEKAQKILFESGCLWNGKIAPIVMLTESKYLFVDSDGAITKEDSDSTYFENHDNKLVSHQEILAEASIVVKKAWANGETIQFNTSGSWFDWRSGTSLALDAYKDWRIKPKTKTIRQWEYKMLSKCGSEVHTIQFMHEALAVESHRDCKSAITAPALKEYEVPND